MTLPRSESTDREIEAAELIAFRFGVLADPTRLRILDSLRESEGSAERLAESIEVSADEVAKHLSALLANGFVEVRMREGDPVYRIPSRPEYVASRGLFASLAMAGSQDAAVPA